MPRWQRFVDYAKAGGYEVTNVDVVEAYDRAIDAANALGIVNDVQRKIQHLIETENTASGQFVRQSLGARIRFDQLSAIQR